MTTIAPDPARVGSAEEADDAAEDGFKPWSAEQAQQWRAANPPLSPWPVVGVQAAVGLMAVAVAWLVSAGQRPPVWSVAYGALAAWLPAVLFARMVARRMRRQANAGSAPVKVRPLRAGEQALERHAQAGERRQLRHQNQPRRRLRKAAQHRRSHQLQQPAKTRHAH